MSFFIQKAHIIRPLVTAFRNLENLEYIEKGKP